MSHSPRPSNPLPPDPDHIPTLNLKCFTNTHLCRSGALTQADLYFSPATGRITPNPHPSRTDDGVERIDLAGAVLAPGFLDLQTNGMNGFHFTQLGGEGRSKAEDEAELGRVARTEVRVGVTGWWGTVPTVEGGRWREVCVSSSFCLSNFPLLRLVSLLWVGWGMSIRIYISIYIHTCSFRNSDETISCILSH